MESLEKYKLITLIGLLAVIVYSVYDKNMNPNRMRCDALKGTWFPLEMKCVKIEEKVLFEVLK